jgi:hypothetical protein
MGLCFPKDQVNHLGIFGAGYRGSGSCPFYLHHDSPFDGSGRNNMAQREVETSFSSAILEIKEFRVNATPHLPGLLANVLPIPHHDGTPQFLDHPAPCRLILLMGACVLEDGHENITC